MKDEHLFELLRCFHEIVCHYHTERLNPIKKNSMEELETKEVGDVRALLQEHLDRKLPKQTVRYICGIDDHLD